MSPSIMNSQVLLRSLAINSARTAIDLPDNHRQTYTDFRALERALFSNDLGKAREAYVRLQTNSPIIAEALSRSPFPSGNQRLRALKRLGRCLLSGDLDGAKAASTKFQS